MEDLKAELIHAKKLASDEDGTVIVWLDQGENGKKAENGESGVQSQRSKANS